MGRGRAPCCAKVGLNKGSWTPEEDVRLISYIHKYGHGNWRALPKLAGLLRCGKSCRLRWINYLRPDIKRGNFTKEEEDAIIKLHGLLGNKWSKIASCLPGRTDNEIKNVWNTHLKKRLAAAPKEQEPQENPDQEQQPSSSSSITTASASCSYEGESRAGAEKEQQTEANIEATSCNGKEETNMMIQDPSLSTEAAAAALLADLPEISPMETELWSMLVDDDMDHAKGDTDGTGDESEKWLAYLEKELDLWGESTTGTATVTADVMEGGDPVASYFQALQFSTSPLDLL